MASRSEPIEEPQYLAALQDDNSRRSRAMRVDLMESALEAEKEAEALETRARELREEVRRARAAADALAP